MRKDAGWPCRNKNRERYLIVKLKNQSYEKDRLSYRNGYVYRDGLYVRGDESNKD